MHRLRRGAPGGLISPTWLWLAAGWVFWALVFAVLAVLRWPSAGYNLGAAVSAEAAWLTLVLFVNSLDELREVITNTPEADRPSHQGGRRLAWGPVAAALLGLAGGWLAWK